jgi:hypothetical protein
MNKPEGKKTRIHCYLAVVAHWYKTLARKTGKISISIHGKLFQPT